MLPILLFWPNHGAHLRKGILRGLRICKTYNHRSCHLKHELATSATLSRRSDVKCVEGARVHARWIWTLSSLSSAAFFEFLSAPTRTGLIPSHPRGFPNWGV